MRVLILGGAGFIGSHLAERLRRDDHAVLTVDIEDSADVVHDLTTGLDFNSGWDQVYMLAAMVGVSAVERDPTLTLDVNVRTVQQLLSWLPRETRLFFASTSEVYAGSVMAGIAPVPTPELVPLSVPNIHNPRFTYAISKIFGEAAVTFSGANAVIGRFHNVYGPRMGKDHAIPALTRRLMADTPLVTIYGCEQTRAFCYVDDAVEAMIQVMATDYRGVVNLGNDTEEVTVEALAGEIAYVLDLDNGDVLLDRHPAPAGSVERRCPDLSLLRSLTLYVPTWTLVDGLKETVKWVVETSQ